MKTSVLLADDHVLVRQAIKSLLEREGFQITGEAGDGQELVRIAEGLQPDVVVLDIGMPLINGLVAARELKRVCPKTKTILLTAHDEDQYVLEALRAGIRGYILKNQDAIDLVSALRQVCRGQVYLSPGISRVVTDAYVSISSVTDDPLSERERVVLQMIAEGKTTKDIAAILGVSVKTAESHRSRLMHKLDIHETASLVRYAVRRGLVQP